MQTAPVTLGITREYARKGSFLSVRPLRPSLCLMCCMNSLLGVIVCGRTGPCYIAELKTESCCVILQKPHDFKSPEVQQLVGGVNYPHLNETIMVIVIFTFSLTRISSLIQVW